MITDHHDTIEPDNKAIQPHIDAIADYFKNYTGAAELHLQSSGGDVVVSAKKGKILDGLEHKHAFANYSSRGIKKCVDCGHEEPLFDLEIKHPRDNGY